MRTRGVRLAVMLLLMGVGAAAGVQGWRTWNEGHTAAAQRRDLHARVDRLLQTAVSLGAVQAGYIAPTRDPAQPLERFPAVLREISAGAAGLAREAHSPEGARALQSLVEHTSSFAQSDARVRDHLLLGDTVAASHVIFGESSAALASMIDALQTFRGAESAMRDADRAAADTRAWMFAGGGALLWLLGLVTFALWPGGPATGAAQEAGGRTLDLERAARLCTAIARVESASALTALLDQAKETLDAAAITVWVRSGQGLSPAVARGHDPTALAELRALAKDEDHPVAAAWRHGELQADTRGTAGVIAAPMWGFEECSGVFSIDTREGRERDPLTHAVVEMIAAQLSNVISGSSAAETRATGT